MWVYFGLPSHFPYVPTEKSFYLVRTPPVQIGVNGVRSGHISTEKVSYIFLGGAYHFLA